ncbi:MAG: type IX secretion system membrane protein PorP/SprF [Crocinitomicaceae bacterium]|nr:type IX secretion system membrane protein PorP/SprF [Crocinitomicaceae bacterium]
MSISENFDRWMFDYKEGNLSAADAEKFENFLLEHPEFEIDADAWDMAYVPAENFVYPDAHKLEKKRRVAGWYYWSAAAMLVLLLTSTSIYLFNVEVQSEPVAVLEANDLNENSDHLINQNQINFASVKSNNLFASLTDNHNFSEELQNNSSISGSQNSLQSIQNLNGLNNANAVAQNNLENREDQYISGNVQNNLLTTENGKINGSNNIGTYFGNPESKALSFDVTKKSTLKTGASISVFRKLYHRVERMLGYPVGLTNLRDQELLLPQIGLLAFNSAFTGGMLKPRFEMSYRNQWLGSDQNSSEMNISFDKYSYALRGGVGLMINAQDYGYGKFGDYNVSLLYSPKLVVNRNVVIEPSVKLTLGTMVANGNTLTPESSFEMDRGRILNTIGADQMNGLSNQWYKDYGLGLMVNTKWFYAGFNSDNLGRHYENVYGNELSSPAKTPVRLSGIAGFDYLSNTKTMTYSPFVAYQQYGNNPEFWAGMNYRLGWFTLGGAISTNKEFTASAGLKFDTFKLVYHFDYTESTLTETRFGSHNIGIRFNAKSKNQRLTH